LEREYGFSLLASSGWREACDGSLPKDQTGEWSSTHSRSGGRLRRDELGAEGLEELLFADVLAGGGVLPLGAGHELEVLIRRGGWIAIAGPEADARTGFQIERGRFLRLEAGGAAELSAASGGRGQCMRAELAAEEQGGRGTAQLKEKAFLGLEEA